MNKFLLFLFPLLLVIGCKGWQGEKIPGFVYYRLNADPRTLDPAKITDVAGARISAKIFNGLVKYNRDYKITGDIAKKWAIDPDGRTYTFILRKNVKFSNGREVTAHDFKYSFERVLSPELRSPRSWLFDKISGAKEFMRGDAKSLKGITLLNKYMLKITLDHPFSPFLDFLAQSNAYVVPKEEVEKWKEDFSSHPVGTGPYFLEYWSRSQKLSLLSNKDYFGEKPKIEGICYRIIPDDLTALIEFEVGNLDIIEVPQSEIKRYRKDKRWSSLMLSKTGLNIYYLGLNCKKMPFNKVNIRKALNYAIDRKKILETFYWGRGILASGPVPPQIKNYTLTGYEYNPTKAKHLLMESAFDFKTIVKIYISANTEALDIVELIKYYLDKVGIMVRIVQLEWSSFLDAINKGEADAFWLSWWADYPNPENFLFPTFHSANWGAGGNRTFFKNQEFDRLIGKYQRIFNNQERENILKRLEDLIIRQAPWVFFWHRKDIYLRQPWLKNFNIYSLPQVDKGNRLYIEK
ncbi:MAG: ABC transporter substrate-binding protein [Thermodesulfobacteriota bacterium]|nr:ABC transporter substrate-binding protein [Thermodesulfobacteriota bacterium]